MTAEEVWTHAEVRELCTKHEEWLALEKRILAGKVRIVESRICSPKPA